MVASPLCWALSVILDYTGTTILRVWAASELPGEPQHTERHAQPVGLQEPRQIWIPREAISLSRPELVGIPMCRPSGATHPAGAAPIPDAPRAGRHGSRGDSEQETKSLRCEKTSDSDRGGLV